VSAEATTLWRQQDARDSIEHEVAKKQKQYEDGARAWAALATEKLRNSPGGCGLRRSPVDQLEGHYCVNCIGAKLAQQQRNMGRRPPPDKCLLCQTESRAYIGTGVLCLACSIAQSVCFECNTKFVAH
jgi:hypothetical protein